ncbi:MAG TPA: ABC transporter permease [Trueperaceae bacterium]|nr:ABC transporter permease [Trueperaceae bacterium]
MTHWQAVQRITAWEFKRFLRLRELITTVVVVAALGAGVPLIVEYLTSRGASTPVTLAVPTGTGLPDLGRFSFVELEQGEVQAALENGTVDGILDLAVVEAPRLVVESEPRWAAELSELLTIVATAERAANAGLEQEELDDLLRPVELRVDVPASAADRGSGAIAAVIGIMLFGIFTGTGLLFTAITGEKTQRVTEQIISAVSPQAWIDGKVLGTSLYVIVNLATIAIGIVLAVIVPNLVRGETIPPLPAIGGSFDVILTTVTFALLGAALYFMLFAAVAATIDDPATSQRSGIIMLPGVFIGLGFLGMITDPGNTLFRTLSYLPLTSPSAMPVRVLAGDAGLIEALISLALLVATVWLARLAAGRIFATGILMTGKEPTWREMLHWARRS